MNLLTKSAIIILLLFALRIIQSCSCPDNPHYFDFDLLTVSNLDNSRDYVRSNETDTMYSASVAFEMRIAGSRAFALNPKSNFSLGFTEATAMEECPIRFVPNQQITKITIRTLEAISSEIPENTDVTTLFLGLVPYTSSGYMYEPIENMYNRINQQSFYDNATATLQLFCKENIQYPKAQFEISVDLSDGRTLTAITNLIHLKPSF
ncbi:MAG: hypothetical protein U5L72_01675 [Bacteroidales bacterium]|nr:hypothetical protein [Bacteroidales bacterium]